MFFLFQWAHFNGGPTYYKVFGGCKPALESTISYQDSEKNTMFRGLCGSYFWCFGRVKQNPGALNTFLSKQQKFQKKDNYHE